MSPDVWTMRAEVVTGRGKGPDAGWSDGSKVTCVAHLFTVEKRGLLLCITSVQKQPGPFEGIGPLLLYLAWARTRVASQHYRFHHVLIVCRVFHSKRKQPHQQPSESLHSEHRVPGSLSTVCGIDLAKKANAPTRKKQILEGTVSSSSSSVEKAVAAKEHTSSLMEPLFGCHIGLKCLGLDLLRGVAQPLGVQTAILWFLHGLPSSDASTEIVIPGVLCERPSFLALPRFLASFLSPIMLGVQHLKHNAGSTTRRQHQRCNGPSSFGSVLKDSGVQLTEED